MANKNGHGRPKSIPGKTYKRMFTVRAGLMTELKLAAKRERVVPSVIVNRALESELTKESPCLS